MNLRFIQPNGFRLAGLSGWRFGRDCALTTHIKGKPHEANHDGNWRRWQAAPADRRRKEDRSGQEVEMNSWAARIQTGLLMALVAASHAAATASIPNTPAAMLLYHGSAALLDWMLAMVVPFLLVGACCKNMQWLLLGSIAANFAGWLLYMSYAPPHYYNLSIWVISGAQLLCLLIPDSRDFADSWQSLVRHAARLGGGNNH